MSHVYIGPTEIIREGLFPSHYDEHVRDFRWWTYTASTRQHDDHVWAYIFNRVFKGPAP